MTRYFKHGRNVGRDEENPDRNREVRWWVFNGGMSYSEAANRVGQGLTRNAVAGIISRTTAVHRANLGPKPL